MLERHGSHLLREAGNHMDEVRVPDGQVSGLAAPLVAEVRMGSQSLIADIVMGQRGCQPVDVRDCWLVFGLGMCTDEVEVRMGSQSLIVDIAKGQKDC
jgi:hypothetical protein